MLKAIIVIIFLAWILRLFYISFDDAFGPEETPAAAVICSEDMQICNDGTMTERVGPNCQFTPCP